jgi:hypothetical protein
MVQITESKQLAPKTTPGGGVPGDRQLSNRKALSGEGFSVKYLSTL